MTTPPPADDVPDDPRPATEWAPPDAPAPDDKAPPGAPAPDEHAPPAAEPVHAGSPVWGAPPGVHRPSHPAAPARTNRLAIVALVTGLLGLVLFAVGFAIAALVQAGRRGEKGKGLAIGGIAASAVWVVAGVVVAALTVTSVFSVDRDDEGRVTKSGKVLASTLRAGDCFVGTATDGTVLVTALPCTQPHDSEVIATSTLPREPYPGDENVEAQVDLLCGERARYLQKSRHFRDLRYYNLMPDELTWADDDRKATCTVHYIGPGTLTSPLVATVDDRLKTFKDLAVGDCLKNWTTDSPVFPVVSCTESHELQVYATFQAPMGGSYAPGDYPPYPGEEKIQKQASRGCEKRAVKLFKKHPPRVPVDGRFVWPKELDWYSGDTQIVCLVTGVEGPLKRSVVPH
ncbi:septum formation family protein [Spirillospora sp. NPDC048819]|uniref:DUF4190 domain-containing protein n=1 Tax=Spirillospora sp. NPDC048819 TaxID=3155268 RepID=UPI0033D961A9